MERREKVYKIPSYVFFFIVLAILISYGIDIAKTSYSKEEFRGGNIALSEAIAIRHMDWANLRVGKAPRLMETMVYGDGSTVTLEETATFVLKKNFNLPVEKMKVEIYLQPEPAMVGIITETNFESSTSALLQAEKITQDVPNRSVHIIESKYTHYNY